LDDTPNMDIENKSPDTFNIMKQFVIKQVVNQDPDEDKQVRDLKAAQEKEKEDLREA